MSRYRTVSWRFTGIKMTKHGHEMWISCLYLWLVICSKNSCSTYLLFRWGLWMTCWRTHGMRMTGSEQDTTQLIHYPILPGTLKIPVTGDSFWVQCPTFIIPLAQHSPELPKHKGEWVGFPWHQICGVLQNNIQFSKHPLDVQQHNLIKIGNQGS